MDDDTTRQPASCSPCAGTGTGTGTGTAPKPKPKSKPIPSQSNPPFHLNLICSFPSHPIPSQSHPSHPIRRVRVSGAGLRPCPRGEICPMKGASPPRRRTLRLAASQHRSCSTADHCLLPRQDAEWAGCPSAFHSFPTCCCRAFTAHPAFPGAVIVPSMASFLPHTQINK